MIGIVFIAVFYIIVPLGIVLKAIVFLTKDKKPSLTTMQSPTISTTPSTSPSTPPSTTPSTTLIISPSVDLTTSQTPSKSTPLVVKLEKDCKEIDGIDQLPYLFRKNPLNGMVVLGRITEISLDCDINYKSRLFLLIIRMVRGSFSDNDYQLISNNKISGLFADLLDKNIKTFKEESDSDFFITLADLIRFSFLRNDYFEINKNKFSQTLPNFVKQIDNFSELIRHPECADEARELIYNWNKKETMTKASKEEVIIAFYFYLRSELVNYSGFDKNNGSVDYERIQANYQSVANFSKNIGYECRKNNFENVCKIIRKDFELIDETIPTP